MSFKLYELANRKFRDCLATKPNDYRALYNWALSLSKQAEIKLQSKEIEAAENLYKEACEKYLR